jgi:hypothetical protein
MSDNITIFGLTAEQSQLVHLYLANAYSLPPSRLAYVAVVEIAEGKYRRRPYLSLAAAQAAVERAEKRGVAARLALCELRPLGGGQ